jgi:hypothetical protein
MLIVNVLFFFSNANAMTHEPFIMVDKLLMSNTQAASAPVVATLFGVGGATRAGLAMHRRTAGITEFEIKKVEHPLLPSLPPSSSSSATAPSWSSSMTPSSALFSSKKPKPVATLDLGKEEPSSTTEVSPVSLEPSSSGGDGGGQSGGCDSAAATATVSLPGEGQQKGWSKGEEVRVTVVVEDHESGAVTATFSELNPCTTTVLDVKHLLAKGMMMMMMASGESREGGAGGGGGGGAPEQLTLLLCPSHKEEEEKGQANGTATRMTTSKSLPNHTLLADVVVMQDGAHDNRAEGDQDDEGGKTNSSLAAAATAQVPNVVLRLCLVPLPKAGTSEAAARVAQLLEDNEDDDDDDDEKEDEVGVKAAKAAKAGNAATEPTAAATATAAAAAAAAGGGGGGGGASNANSGSNGKNEGSHKNQHIRQQHQQHTEKEKKQQSIHQKAAAAAAAAADATTAPPPPSLSLVVCVSGWLNDGGDFERPWGAEPSEMTFRERLMRLVF